MNQDHHSIIIQQFKKLFLQNIEDFFDIELNISSEILEEHRPFHYNDQVCVYLDLNGSVIGFLGITMKETVAASLLNLSVSKNNRKKFGPVLRELLNVIGGAITSSISAVYPLVTLTSPRIVFGTTEFPQNSSASINLKTQLGDFELFYATDEMSLKVIELLNKVQEQKKNLEISKKEVGFILENVPTALLTFDLEDNIGIEYSKTAEDIFGNHLKSRKASSLLFQTDKNIKNFKGAIELLPTANLSFDDIMGLAPSKDTLFFNEQKYHLQYKYVPIYNDDNQESLSNIMVLAEDLTDKIALEEETKRRAELADFIHKVLKNKDYYVDFLSEVNENLRFLKTCFNKLNHENITDAFRACHTIKGNSSIYGIRKLRDCAHSLESLLVEIKEGEVTLDVHSIEKVKNNYASLIQTFDKHITDAESMFGDDFDPRKEIERKYIIKESNLSKLMNLTDNPSMLNELERIRLKRIYIYLASYEDLVYNLSQKLNKKIHALKIIGAETLIDPDRWKSFFASFVHLIRNCVDHGIEDYDERLNTKKPEYATISIEIIEANEGITITVTDDGRGIDTNKISDIAISKGIISYEEVSKMSEKDKQMLIFMAGFSTKEEVSNISGRGIGMDAVLYEVNRMKGSITLKSELGKGTNFIIKVPYLKHDDSQNSLDIQNERIFSRIDLPIYLTVKREDGTQIGQIVNMSPDGFRLLTNGINISNDDILLNIELPAESFKENTIRLIAKPMNSNTLKKKLTEWGCVIVKFCNEKSQKIYEEYLRTLYI